MGNERGVFLVWTKVGILMVMGKFWFSALWLGCANQLSCSFSKCKGDVDCAQVGRGPTLSHDDNFKISCIWLLINAPC